MAEVITNGGLAKVEQIVGATPAQGVDELVKREFDEVNFKFKRLVAYTPGESWVLMIYGPSKTGKTFTAASAASEEDGVLFLNLGDGIETLLAPAFKLKYPRAAQNIIMVDLREAVASANSTATAFDAVCSAIDEALAKFKDKFQWVVLDEATAFRRYAMNKAMELNTAERTKTRPKRTDEFVKPEIGDFGVEMQMIEWFLGTYIPIFKEAGKHFVMLAHERQTFAKPAKIGDDPVLKRVLPGFTGKTFPDQIPAYFDDVWHSEVVGGGSNVVYRVRTAGSESEIGGARHGGIFEVVELDPNLQKMLARIKLAQKHPKFNVR